jgi:hypothetical protein
MIRGTGIQVYVSDCGTYPYSVKHTLLLKKLNWEISDRFEGFTMKLRSPVLLNVVQSGSLNVKIVTRICRRCQRIFLLLFCVVIIYNIPVIVYYSIRTWISSHKLLITDVRFSELTECT